MPRQMIPVLLLLTSLALLPSAKADVFKYDVQLTDPLENAHVIFELPSFQETVENQTTFDLATWSFAGSPTELSISGNSTGCAGSPGSPGINPGPCIVIEGGTSGFLDVGPAFSSPGTYTAGDVSVSITDISGVPEPSALVLLSSCLLGVGLVVRKRRCHQRAEARES
jgi:PEP-CTERM motif